MVNERPRRTGRLNRVRRRIGTGRKVGGVRVENSRIVIMRWSLTVKEGYRRSRSTQSDHGKAEGDEGLKTHEELRKTCAGGL
jgi:hypothetical protein